ncbi:hypothetical protein FITA111629_13800 [Filibacter tadaridae]|uniref:Uncharacterized protein n=1 Tax=Filibacter tadaridae TaxID=2483811 RepID=A0A3P5XPQ6_9BACL|nr:hypothetical protein [Filibacter tadaridae]VDC33700.1 hypothetical protein FILTAD_03010 [Filibacter tadaridae]
MRTYERWIADDDVMVDKRLLTKRLSPRNKSLDEEKAEIIAIDKQTEYAHLLLTQIVPRSSD